MPHKLLFSYCAILGSVLIARGCHVFSHLGSHFVRTGTSWESIMTFPNRSGHKVTWIEWEKQVFRFHLWPTKSESPPQKDRNLCFFYVALVLLTIWPVRDTLHWELFVYTEGSLDMYVIQHHICAADYFLGFISVCKGWKQKVLAVFSSTLA